MSTPTTTAATTNAVVTETAPEAVKVKRTWKEFRTLMWAYVTFPARKSWEVITTLTEQAVRTTSIAAMAVFMGYMVYCGVSYASFLGRLEAQTAAAHERLIEANTPKSFTQWLYGVTVQPVANADGYVRGAVGLGE
jgi:hypothetical protein